MKLKGRHALLTGGSGGIGIELAEGLLAEGAKLTILDMVPPAAKLHRLHGVDHRGTVTEVYRCDAAHDAVLQVMDAREHFGVSQA